MILAMLKIHINSVVCNVIDLNFNNFTSEGILRVSFDPYIQVLGNLTWGIVFGFIGGGLYANERSISLVTGYLILVGIFFSIILPYWFMYLFGLMLAFVLTVIFFIAFVKKKSY